MALKIGHGGRDVISPIRENLIFMSNYVDFLTGEKTDNFYYGYLVKDASELGTLWKTLFTSKTSDSGYIQLKNSWTKEVDVDFDFTITAERLIHGTARVNGKWNQGTNVGDDTYGYVIVKLIRDDGSNESIICTTQSETYHVSSPGTHVTTDVNFDLLMDVAKTELKPGEILRLTIELWAKADYTDEANKIKLFYDGSKHVEIPFARLDEY